MRRVISRLCVISQQKQQQQQRRRRRRRRQRTKQNLTISVKMVAAAGVAAAAAALSFHAKLKEKCLNISCFLLCCACWGAARSRGGGRASVCPQKKGEKKNGNTFRVLLCPLFTFAAAAAAIAAAATRKNMKTFDRKQELIRLFLPGSRLSSLLPVLPLLLPLALPQSLATASLPPRCPPLLLPWLVSFALSLFQLPFVASFSSCCWL